MSKIKEKKKKELHFPYKYNFCINCNKETTFVYDRVIGHSKCIVCGFFGPDSNTHKGQIVAEKRK